MDRTVLALATAVAYPTEAFAPQEPDAPDAVRSLLAAAAAGCEVDLAARELLASHLYLNDWIQQVLEHPQLLPPHLRREVTHGREAKAPRHEPMAELHQCEVDGLPWYRTTADEPVPDCPLAGDEPDEAARHRIVKA